MWEFIQNIIGKSEVKKHGLKPSHTFKDCEVYYISYFDSHVVGKYVFINPSSDEKIIFRHEYGHRIQSKILGPLYYLVIFIPSYLYYLYWSKRHDDNDWDGYYKFYTERWADNLTKNLK